MPLSIGQGSGDFRELGGRVHVFHVGNRNSIGVLSPDAFTQANPPVVTAANTVSSTLANIAKQGVLGSSIAFTRPDVGNGVIGGPVAPGGTYNANIVPLGIFINDSLGNAFENTPGVASNRGPYLSGQGALGLTLWETENLLGTVGSAGDDLTYSAGDKLYASANGLVTNLIQDAYEYNVAAQNDPDFVTVIGVVKIAPDANNSLMVIDLRV